VALLLGPFAACKRHTPGNQPSAGPSAAPSALPAAVEESRCRKVPGSSLTLEGEAAPSPPTGEPGEDDDDALLPFGVDLGSAIATPKGFALGGVSGKGQAFVALLDENASRRVDLGELHGDPETPGLASAGDRVVVALRSTDAAGFTIKLGSIALAGGGVEWGHELTKLGSGVTGLDLAVTGARGVLVFQSETKQGRLMLGSFAAALLKEPFEVRALDVKDGEMPRVVARPGGFWLSWVRSLPEPKKAAPASAKEPPQDPEERALLDPGPRVVEVVKLDEQGHPLGAALRVGEPRRQILLYDVATTSDGGLLVATRSDSAAPGAEGGAILLTAVSADGTAREERLDDDEIGAGAPTLLSDVDVARPSPWLTVSAPNDATRLGLASGARTRLQSDPLLGRSEVIAVSSGRFLAQRARGSSVVLEALECSWPSDAQPENK